MFQLGYIAFDQVPETPYLHSSAAILCFQANFQQIARKKKEELAGLGRNRPDGPAIPNVPYTCEMEMTVSQEPWIEGCLIYFFVKERKYPRAGCPDEYRASNAYGHRLVRA